MREFRDQVGRHAGRTEQAPPHFRVVAGYGLGHAGHIGQNDAREAVVTASARTVPDSSCRPIRPLLKDIGICPPNRSLIEGAPPL